MKNMKLYMLCGVLVLGLAACQAEKEPVTPLPTGEAAVEAQASVFQSLRMANGNALAAVSYTHLDVYKRQNKFYSSMII